MRFSGLSVGIRALGWLRRPLAPDPLDVSTPMAPLGDVGASVDFPNWTWMTISPTSKSTPTYAERASAERRARRLLSGLLTPTQRRQLRDDGFFVRGSAGGLFYLSPRWQMAWGLMRNGAAGRYCLQPADIYTPMSDRLIAWKMMIESDERGFRRKANYFREYVDDEPARSMRTRIRQMAAWDAKSHVAS